MNQEKKYATEQQSILEEKKIIPLLSLITFFSVLNGTMFNIAIPTISLEFNLLPSQVSWVVTGYIVIFALASIIYGKLADTYPLKILMTTGILLFNIGSLIGFFSQWYGLLILGRLIQAAGAGAIPALGMLMATRYFPPQERGKVLGVIASTVAFGSGIGPIVGGFITGEWHWRFLFLISLITLVAIFFFYKWLPDEERKSSTLDLKGAILLGGAVATILFTVNQLVWWLLPLGILLLTWFVIHIRCAEQPFIHPYLFLHIPYRNGLITGFLTVGTVFGMMFMIPLLLQLVNQLEASEIGMVMFPGAMSAALMGMIGGRLADRKGSVPIVYTGLSLIWLGFLLFSSFVGSSVLVIALILVICYTGFSFIQSALASTVAGTLPPEQTGIGMGMYNLVFFMSGAFGSAIVGKVLDYSQNSSALNPFVTVQAASIYSNLFLGFIVIISLAFIVFYFTFHAQHSKFVEEK